MSTNPVYAGQQVQISSPQLEDRCGQGWRWEPNGDTAVFGIPPTIGTAIATLDNDGNTAFVFKGSSCAAGTSTVTADVLAGSHPTYSTTFKVMAPRPKSVAQAAETAAEAASNARKTARTRAMMTLTLSPTPVTEIGFTPSGDLSITKTDNDGGSSITSARGTTVPGTSITYTIVASNAGPTTATGASVTDALSLNPAITSDTWTATGSGGAIGFSIAGTGNISDSVNLPPGGSVTYTVVAAVSPSAMGTLTNTATVTPPIGYSDTNPGANSASDTDTLKPDDGLTITKTDDHRGSVVAGTPITYTIVVTDAGPSDTSHLSVVDTLPAQGLTNISSPNVPSGVTFSPGTNTWTLATLPAGHSVTLQLAGTVPSGATGSTYTNTASASATDASTVTATDTDTLSAQANLTITKTDGVSSIVAGTPDTYTIVVSNTGPSSASNLSVVDTLPAQGLTNISSPNVPSGVTFTAATDSWTLATLPAGQSVTLELAGTVPSGATGSTYTNTASASATDASTVTATDTDTLSAQANLTITKTDGVSSIVAGTPDTYTIVVSNTGPSSASNLSVVDTLPAQGLTNISSPNVPSGVTFTAATDSWTLATLPAGQSVTLELAGTVPSGATGSTYTNTATASATDASTVTATDTDTLSAQANLTITKTDNDGGSSVTTTKGTAVPGTSITYTIVASNSGPSAATGASVTDPLALNPAITSDTWTGIASGGTTGVSASGSGNINDSLTIPAGGSVTYTVVATIPSSATGTLSNTASASATDASTVTATDTDTLSAQANLTITKTDNDGGTAVPGTSITYTIVASNSGPSAATGASVTDPLALNPAITSDTWTGIASGGTTGVSASGSGNINDSLTIPAGGSVTYTVVATIPSSATGTLSNTASASATDASTVTATDTDTLSAQANLTITKTDNDGGTAVPGTSITYTIVASNSGPSAATGASVTDPLALNPAITSDTWTGIASGGTTGVSASGSGNINDSLTIPAGGSVTYTVVATIPSSATGTLSNTASASATDASTVTATDTDTLSAQANLTITKTDGVSSIVAGTPDTYTIVVSNTGPSSASNLSVVDTLPAQGLTNISSPNVPSGVTFTAATDSWTLATLPAGQSVTLELAGTVPSGATGSTYTNTATASATDASTVTATDTDTLSAQANLTITKTDGVSSIVAGTPDTYTIVVSNTGPSSASNLSVVDTLPAQGLTNISSPNVPSGVTFTAATDSWTLATLPAGQSVTLELAGTVPSGATGSTYTNTASASATDASTVTATDTDTLSAQANLTITKTDNDGGSSVTTTKGTAVPGTSITYTIVASNSGPSAATGASVTDPLALNPAITSDTWTGIASGGTTGVSASGSGNINDSLTIPAGGSVTYTVVATIPSSATGTLSNTASASATDASTVTATDTDTLSAQANLTITKTDNDGGTAVPGTSITYTIVASNSGPSAATGASVTDPLALNPAITSDTWTGIASGGTTGVSASGSGNINDSLTIPAGGSVTYTVVATIPSSATGTLSNTASASATDASTVTATDTDTLSAHANLTITKTDNDGGTAVPGTSITYTIVASNSGPSAATGASVTDPLALNPAITSDTWTGIASGGTTGVSASGSGNINDSLSIPAGGSVTYTVVATIPSSATGTLSNTASASATDASTVTATDTDTLSAQANLTITKTDGVSSIVAGTPDTYTIVVSNTGPSSASNLSVVDTLPAQGLTNISSPNVPSGVTFTAATDSWTLATLPAGQSVTLELAGTVPSGATGSTYTNTASASATDASTVTATDTDTLSAQANLTITKTDGVSSIVAGTPDTYTIVVSNTGPSSASNLSVVDTLPAQGLTNISSPNVPSGVTFTAATDSWTLATLPAGQSVTLELAGTVPSGATGSTYTNTATASATDASTVTATDTDTLSAQANLTITKTDNDGGSSVTGAVGTTAPGASLTYTVVASNAGPSDVTGVEIYDPVSVIHAITSDTWTAAASGGATGFTPSGSGNIDDIVTIPAGGSVTYTVVASVSASATGTLSNSVTLTPPLGFTNTNPLASSGGAVSATDSDTLAQANLTVMNTDGVSSIGAGTADTYTIVVSNTGPSSASNLSVVDTLPVQGLTNISSPGLPSGVTFTAATDSWTLATLPAGQSVTLELAGTVPSGATGSTYTDGVTASASDASAVSATDTDTLGSQGDVTITLADNVGGSSAAATVGTVVAGSSITYTIVAANSGPSTVSGAETYDPLSVVHALTSDTWTAAGSGGATGFTPSGSGSIDDIVTIPAGASVTYTVVATVSPSASGTLSNVVTLTPPADFANTNPLATFGGAVSAGDRDTISPS